MMLGGSATLQTSCLADDHAKGMILGGSATLQTSRLASSRASGVVYCTSHPHNHPKNGTLWPAAAHQRRVVHLDDTAFRSSSHLCPMAQAQPPDARSDPGGAGRARGL